MAEWKRQGETVCMPNTVCCAMAADGEEARMIVAAHNAICDAYEARIAEVEVAAQQGHPSPCTFGTLCPYCEIDRLRGKLDDVRMGIGCARGQRTTQFCAEAAQRDEIIGKLLAMLLPGEEPKPEQYDGYDQLFRERLCRWNDNNKRYARACEIAGRTE